MTLRATDPKFIDTLYGMSVATLMQMNKTELQELLIKLSLAYRWTEGILALVSNKEEGIN